MATVTAKPVRTWRRFFLRWLLFVAITYLGVVVVFLALENYLLYHPAGPDDWTPAPTAAAVKDVELAAADGTPIHGWWFAHANSELALLYFHGNAGNLSWSGEHMMLLRDQLKTSVLIVDYPGYGKSGGTPSEVGCYAAADAAYAWLTQEKKIRPENILIMGDSLGGAIAVDLASRQPHRALILTKTFTSMADVGQRLYPWLPVRWLVRNRFESLAKMDRCRQPLFISHGTADALVPFSQGERLFQAAHEPKQFLPIEGGTHNDPEPARFYEELKDFLNRTTPPAVK